MKKSFFLTAFLLLAVMSGFSQDPVVGTWKGTYGNGTSQTGNFYSLRFNPDGTMNVLYPDGNIICSGRYTFQNNIVTGTYYYNGNQPFSFTGTYNPANITISGTGGAGQATSGSFGWIMTSRQGGQATPTFSARPQGNFTKAAQSGVSQPAAAQPRQMSPASGGMVITGTVQLPPAYKYDAVDLGAAVTTRLEAAQGSSGRLFPNVTVRTISQQADNSDPSSDCTVCQRSVTATSDNFLNTNYGARTANIYPGAIYLFNEFMAGNYRPVEQGRNPIVLSSTNLANTSGQVFRNVDDPKSYNILQAVSDIVRPYSSQVGSGNIDYQVFESNNNAQLMISATAGGGYAGFSAYGGYRNQDNANYSYLTIDAIKPMYTIQVNVPANGYLSNLSALTASGTPVVIRSVVYGCRVLANVEIRNGNSQTDISFQAGLKTSSMSAEAAFNYLKATNNATSQVNCLVVGGPTTTTVYPDPKTLREGISDIFARTTLNMAQPIAYVLSDLNGNILRVVSATDVFTDRDCRPKNGTYRLTGIDISVTTGMNDEKNNGSKVDADLFNSAGVIVASMPNPVNVVFPVNTTQPLNLQPATNDIGQTGLNAFEKGGFIDIFFDPVQIFAGWDEWQITKIQVTLEFRDQNGTLANGYPIKLDYPITNIYLKKNEQRLRIPFTMQLSDPKNINTFRLVPGNIFKPGF